MLIDCKQIKESSSRNNFLKRVKWAPDGSCFAVCSDEGILYLFNLPMDYTGKDFTYKSVSEFDPILKYKESSPFQDMCFYPMMNSSNPSTCCFFACSKHSPVRLYDAYTGEILCSYSAFDHVERPMYATSLTVDWNCTNLLCGFKRSVGIFDIARNDSKLTEFKLKSKKPYIHGLISCIAVNTNDHIIGIGTFSKSVGLYDQNFELIATLNKVHSGGITQISFVEDKNILVTGARKDNYIHIWDLRSMSSQPLATLHRRASTNQRIDIDIKRNTLCSGSTDGRVLLWNLGTLTGGTCCPREPEVWWNASCDCINGVSFNPFLDILVTSSGQRNRCFKSKQENEEDDDPNVELVLDYRNCDNSVVLWHVDEF